MQLEKNKSFIIAEAGVNHNGRRDLAFKLVDIAVAAGADAVKFQTFKAEKLVTKRAKKADYQQQITGGDESQYEMLKMLELNNELHRDLMNYCQENKIHFLSTAFDEESLWFLANELDLQTLKIPSGEITNGPLLLEHARLKRDIILSTGMATLKEIEEALGVIAFGLLHGPDRNERPSKVAFSEAFSSDTGKQVLKEKVTLMHCTSEYPAPVDEVNLNAIGEMRSMFGLNVGYSDHTQGIAVPTAVAALGVKIIEKHFTLDRDLPGPDHKASLDPDELKDMVKAVRTVEAAMGDGKKIPSMSELKNRDIARKSLVASSLINIGESLTSNNMTIKRPGTGISPMQYWDMLGAVAKKRYLKDEVIR